jgi:hypothetical protein
MAPQPVFLGFGMLGSIEVLLIFPTNDLLKINPAPHHRPNETLSCPYNGVCWMHHMEE